MNPFEYSKAFTDFWSLGSKAMLQAQQGASQMLTESMNAMASGAVPTVPAMPNLADTAELTRASQAFTDLWGAAASLSGDLASRLPQLGNGDQTVEATFRKMTDPRTWLATGGEMEDVLSRMAEGPRLADLWDVERRYARVMQAWLELRRRSLEHQAVVLQAWLHAGKTFTEKQAGHGGADGKAADAKAALSLWTETANQVLLDTQRSPPFLETQTALIRASADLKIVQRELVEYYGERFGFPTRTELDDVHRTVTELRREMRALRRQARTQQAQAQPVQAQPIQAAPAKPRKPARQTMGS